MLAMSGADLNAKNKNDETPSGTILLFFAQFFFSFIFVCPFEVRFI